MSNPEDRTTGVTSDNRIVVGVDGSVPAQRALSWALFMARAMGGVRIEAVAAWQSPTNWGAAGLLAMPVDWNPAQEAEKLLRETVDDVVGPEPGVTVDVVVHEGSAAKVLIEASTGAQMLIVGSRGHGGFTGLLLGSVSTACAEHAGCPVLVVHGQTPPPPNLG